MNFLDLENLETLLERTIARSICREDPAHDVSHLRRVVKTAKQLATLEKARLDVVVPAAWLHDFVNVPKSDPRRPQASRLSAQAALQFLREIEYPEETFPLIAHAIEAHSFSAGLEPKTVEAKVVQDADRLDAIGAIGIARCFATAGIMHRAFYSESDPFCQSRACDDGRYALDHFFSKLFKIASSLKTDAGRAEGKKRLLVMERFLSDLAIEIET